MMRYLIQPRDWILYKVTFCLLLKNSKNIVKIISETLSDKYSQKLLDNAKQSAVDVLKTTSKRLIKKQQKQLANWLEIKLLIKLQLS